MSPFWRTFSNYTARGQCLDGWPFEITTLHMFVYSHRSDQSLNNLCSFCTINRLKFIFRHLDSEDGGIRFLRSAVIFATLTRYIRPAWKTPQWYLKAVLHEEHYPSSRIHRCVYLFQAHFSAFGWVHMADLAVWNEPSCRVARRLSDCTRCPQPRSLVYKSLWQGSLVSGKAFPQPAVQTAS
jgi:hypothetical protein